MNYTAQDYHRAKPSRAVTKVDDRSTTLSIILIVTALLAIACRLLGVA